jgi:hypothetical protein
MRRLIAAFVIGAAAGFAGPVAGHHSAALLFDLAKQVTMEGVVTRFELGNPHMRIYFTPDGQQTEWMAEGGSRTVLLRRGWSPDELRKGDHIRLEGNPSRDGSGIVHILMLTLADGRQLGTEDLLPDTLDAARAHRRPTPE